MNPPSLLSMDSALTGAAWVVWAVLFTLAFPAELSAKPPQYISWAQVERDYAPPREQAFAGRIQRVRFLKFMDRDPAVCVDLVQAGDHLRILLAPSQWLASKAILLSSGLTLTGVGSTQTSGQETWIIAREITVQGKRLAIRDKGGKPFWPAAKPKTQRTGGKK